LSAGQLSIPDSGVVAAFVELVDVALPSPRNFSFVVSSDSTWMLFALADESLGVSQAQMSVAPDVSLQGLRKAQLLTDVHLTPSQW
jgi:hypothetical protein